MPILERFLTIFGDIKIYPSPMFLLYDPKSYQMKGEDVREAIDRIRPGDILLRGYKRYLDGYLIPGYFSHAALYLGEVDKKDVNLVPEKCRGKFRAGKQMVVHSMAEGVFLEDLLTFCRCDYMGILRFPGTIEPRLDAKRMHFDDSEFTYPEKHIRSTIESQGTFEFEKAFPVIREVALKTVGCPYDFKLNFDSHQRLSCTEFVYFCTKSLSLFLQIQPLPEQILFVRRPGIKPDAFLNSGLEKIWASPSTDAKVWPR